MLIGHVGRIESHCVGGWAVDSELPNTTVDVVIYVDGLRIAQVPCDIFRADLLDLKIYGEGRHGFVHYFTTPLPLELLRRVTVRYACSGAIIPGGDRVLPGGMNLDPILVTAPGRSGTTFIMNRFARSPQICVAETPPFEVRLISYWSTAVRVLTGAADYDRSMHPDKLEGDGFKVGSNPFSSGTFAAAFRTADLRTEYFQSYARQELSDSAFRMIVEYYSRLRYDQRKVGAVFFAEKNNNLQRQTRMFAKSLFGGLREVVLIRDPRDLLCSQLAYFQAEPESIFQGITNSCNELMRISRDEADSVTSVKYEDMILSPDEVCNALMAQFGIDDAGILNESKEKSVFRVHGTSSSPEASIGRWKAELTSAQKDLCTMKWRDFLILFKYDS